MTNSTSTSQTLLGVAGGAGTTQSSTIIPLSQDVFVNGYGVALFEPGTEIGGGSGLPPIYYINTNSQTIVKSAPDAVSIGEYSSLIVQGSKIDQGVATFFGFLTITPDNGVESSPIDTSTTAYTYTPASDSGISSVTFKLYSQDVILPENLLTTYTINVVFQGPPGVAGAPGADGLIGQDALLYNIAVSSPVIVKDAPDAFSAGVHTSVTIQGKKYQGTNTYNFGFITITANGATEPSSAVDTSVNPVILAPGNNDGKSYYTVKMYDDAFKTNPALDVQTIYIVFKGAKGDSNIVLDLSNDNTAVPAGPDGSVSSFANASTTATVYYGASDDSSNWTFTQNLQPDVGLAVTASNNNRTAEVTALSADSGYIDFVASRTGYPNQTARFTITKQKTGATGTNGAQYVVVNGDQVFIYDSGMTVPVSTSITATAALYGGLTSYSWQYWNGTSWNPLSGTNNTASYVLSYDNAAWTTDSLRIRCISDIYFDEITIVKMYSGTSSVTGLLTNESATIPTLYDGSGGVYTTAGGNFKVWEGITDVTSLSTFSVFSSSVGLTISINSAGLYTASLSNAVDSGTATLRAVYNSVTIDKIYNVSKSKQGANGIAGLVIDLTNDVSTVPTDSAGNNGNYSNATTTASIYLGNVDDSSNWTFDQTISTGLSVTSSVNKRTATVTSMSVDTGYIDFTATKPGFPNQSIRYTISKVKSGVQGTSATVNYLELSSATIKRDKSGAFNPTPSIIFYGKQITGNASAVNYTGIFKIYTQSTTGGAFSLVVTSTAVSSYTYTFPTTNTTALKVELYDPLGTTLYDYEIIPYLFDGTEITSYDIITSAPVITKQAPDAATSGVHSSITIQGKQYIGSITNNYGYVTITANGSIESGTATAASSPITLAPGDADGKLYYTIKLYNQATVSGATLLDTQVVYVVFKGATGTPGVNGIDAKYVVVTGEQAFKFLAGSSTPTSSTIVLSATLYGFSGTDYQWQYYNGGAWSNISGATLSTYTVAYNDSTLWPNSSVQSIRIRCLSFGYNDEITIVKLYDGTNGINGTSGISPVVGLLTNESVVVGTLADGSNGDYSVAGGTFKLYEGTTDKTGMGIIGGYGVTYSIQASTVGLSITLNQSGVYAVSNLTVDTASATLRANYTKSDGTNINIDKVYSIAKSRTGKSSIIPVLTNESHTFPANQYGDVTTYLNSGTKIYVYEGTETLNYDGVGTSTGTWKVTISASNITAGSVTALNDGTGGISVGDSTGMTNSVATITFTISGTAKTGAAFSISKIQTLSKTLAGLNAIIKYIDLQYTVITKNALGVFSPAGTFPIKAKQIEGSTLSDFTNARFKITPIGQSTIISPIGASYNYSYSTTSSEFKIELVDANDINTVLDTETIPVVSDGSAFLTLIESTNGTEFRVGQAKTTTLIAHVFLNGVEVTSSISETRFSWRRVSVIPKAPPNDDATWNAAHSSGYKQITISIDEVDSQATFFCDIINP